MPMNMVNICLEKVSNCNGTHYSLQLIHNKDLLEKFEEAECSLKIPKCYQQ